MKYLERMGFDKLIVYDNQSSDNTVELLKKYPFVEIRTLNTGGSKSNQMIIDVKNRVWKEFKNEKDAWMFVSDFDEVVYYDGILKEYLKAMGDEGYNYLNQDMVQTICENFQDKEKLVHETCDCGSFWGNSNVGGCKMTLFKINDFVSITYSPGAHSVRVKLKENLCLKSLNDKKIKSFHLKFIDKNYCLERKHLAKKRRGPEDIRRGFGVQYERPDSEFLNEWDKMRKASINIVDYINGSVCGSDGVKCISGEVIGKDNPIGIVNLMYGNTVTVARRNIIKKRTVIRKYRN
jgi:hypothetical protein